MEIDNKLSLYHYTTFESLEGIIESKELWLGNLRYMNDRMELMYLLDGLCQTIKLEIPEFSDKIDGLFKEQNSRFDTMTSFAFSLSTLNDDAAQWDRYSNKGRGVCLRFNVDNLINIIKGKAILQPVYYLENMKNHQIKALIELYITNGIIGNGFSSIDEIFDNAWASSVAYKHPSFKAESEVRICSYPYFPNNDFKSKLKYKITSTGLREYLPINICGKNDQFNGSIVDGIILGSNSGVDIDMFYRYLQMKNVDVSTIEVIESNCPLI